MKTGREVSNSLVGPSMIWALTMRSYCQKKWVTHVNKQFSLCLGVKKGPIQNYKQ